MSSYFEPLNLHTHLPTLVAAEVAGMDNLELVHNVVPLDWKTGEREWDITDQITKFGTRLPYLHFWQNFFDPPGVKNSSRSVKMLPHLLKQNSIDGNCILTSPNCTPRHSQ